MPSTFYPGIQALRGLAAVAVVVQHAVVLAHLVYGADYNAVLKMNFGITGVLIFFCISGFVIGTNSHMPFVEFAGRRLLRIYPPFWVAIAIMFLVTPNDFAGAPIGLSYKTALLLPSQALPSFNIPFWTLVYEVFFYALAAIAFSAKLSRNGLTILFTTWILLVQLVAVYSKAVNPLQPGAWIAISAYTQFFAAGLIAAVNIEKLKPVGPVIWMMIAAGAMLGAQLTEAISIVANSLFLAVSMTSVILAASAIVRLPRILLLSGDASYGIYLVHWIAIVFVIERTKPMGVSLSLTIMLAIATALVTGVCFGWIEAHFYKAAARKIWRGRSSKVPAPLPDRPSEIRRR